MVQSEADTFRNREMSKSSSQGQMVMDEEDGYYVPNG